MVADPGDPPPIRRRTRIKVNLPVVSETLNTSNSPKLIVNSQQDEEHISTNDDEIENHLGNDAKSYDIYKFERTEIKIASEDIDGIAETDDVLIPTPKSTLACDPPKPAPRTKVVQRAATTDVESTKPLDENSPKTCNEHILPQPKLRTLKPMKDLNNEVRDVQKEVKIEKKDNRKKKILKAADVISSVLRRETKGVPQIATVLPETGEENIKGKEDSAEETALGSPWDSPPPPQMLDKVYIQNKHGFSVHEWADLFKKPDLKAETSRSRQLTDIALYFHNLWTRFMTFSHGVIAGIACCHILSVAAARAATNSDVEQFVQFYHFLSLKVHFAVYVFTTLCIVSCFDRLDIGELSKSHLRDVGQSHGTLFTTVAYLFCLIISLAAHRHTAAIDAYNTNHDLWDAQGFQEWYLLVTCRDAVLVLIWICIAFSPRSDLLHDKLTTMGQQSRIGSGLKMSSLTERI